MKPQVITPLDIKLSCLHQKLDAIEEASNQLRRSVDELRLALRWMAERIKENE